MGNHHSNAKPHSQEQESSAKHTPLSSPAPSPNTPAPHFLKRIEETESSLSSHPGMTSKRNSQQHLEGLKAHFLKSHPNGLLTVQEFTRENQLLHPNSPESFWEALFHFLDEDENGFLDLREYLIAYSLLTELDVKQERLEFWFSLLDKDLSGEITLDECEYLFGILLNMSDVLGKKQQTEESEEEQIDEHQSSKTSESTEERFTPSQNHEQRISRRITDLFCRMDADHDGKVTFKEFQESAQNDDLLKHLLHIEIDLEKQEELHKALHLNPRDFELQVGGHGSEKQVKKTNVSTAIISRTNDFLFKRKDRRQPKDAIIKSDDKLWKPLEKREFAFYEYVHHASRDNDPVTARLREFIPKYYGRTFVDYEDPSPRTVYYLILEDCTNGMSEHACVADLKIGTKGHDSQASLKKRAQQIALCEMTSSRKLGFRFCGYKKWDRSTNSVSSLSKFQGGLLMSGQVQEHLEQFINNGECMRYGLYKKALEKLVAIRDWFRVQRRYSFYSSSILLCYDGDSDDDEEMVVKMIDFAHVEIDEKEKELDRSYLIGIEKMVELIEQIVRLHETRSGVAREIGPE